MALALRRRDEAAGGRGGLLLFGGEAGIGKSRLLDEVADAARGRIVHAEVFADDRDTPGLLLLGIATGLRRAGDTGSADRVRELVLAAGEGDGSAGHRRLLVAELADVLSGALGTPLLLRLEDLHWADQLSLDVLHRIAPALPELPSMIVGTYRSEEPVSHSGFTTWRLELLAHRQAEEVLLSRFDVDGTRRMLASITGVEPSADEAERLHEAADGIPLHIEELVAVGVGTVPETVGDAVLSRVDTLSEAARDAVAAAAVLGRKFDRAALLTVLGDERDTSAPLEAAIDELLTHHFIVATADQNPAAPNAAGTETFDFRHALLRDAVYGSLPASRRRSLHARVVAGMPGLSDAVLSVHCERAGLADEAYLRARRAADRASALSAHREAVGLYRRAERTVPSGTPSLDRAELHRRLAAELAAADANEDAEREYRRAIELLQDAGDPLAAAALVAPLVAARHLLGVGYDDRAAALTDALHQVDAAVAPPAPPAEADRVRGRLLAALAAAAMLDRRLDASLRFATEARVLLADDVEERIAVDVTRGSVMVFAGEGEPGWELLESAAEEAAAGGWEAAAARAYRMLGSSASVLLQYRRGRDWLRDGIAYATRIERWNDVHYLEAHLAHVEWATGELAAAHDRATRARADGRGGITTEVTALHVLGYVALARGELAPARELLSAAAAIGERMRELQRLSPALWGLAEIAVRTGDSASAVALCSRALEESRRIGDAAYLFPFVVTGMRAHLAAGDVTSARQWLDETRALVSARGIPGTEHAVEHAEGLLAIAERHPTVARERLNEATDGWSGLGRWWEGTSALLDTAECARRTRNPAEAAALGARARELAVASGGTALVADADELSARLAAGVAPTVLSAREHEVARLVATGATNRAIGETLHIAPKTVATHVEHILLKLGASRRAEIAAWVVDDARERVRP